MIDLYWFWTSQTFIYIRIFKKKMLRIAKERFGQIFIATHSSEILNEADSGDILLVNSGHRSAQRVVSDDAFRRLYSYIGSSENAEFARLARADRIVFFEGGDKKLLRKLAAKARLDDIFQDSKTVYLQTGGFSQWTRVREVDWALHNIFHLEVRIAAIFDRDYRCIEEVDAFKASLANENLWVDVLGRKEIENYLIVIRPLTAAIQQRLLARGHNLSLDEIRLRVLQLTDGFRDVCRTQQIAHYISHHGDVDRHTALPTHISRANQRFEENWENEQTRFAMLPGKDFISVLSATFQRDFGASVTANQILDEMTPDEVPEDIIARLNDMAAFLRR